LAVGGSIGILGGVCSQYGTGASLIDLVIGAFIGAVIGGIVILCFPRLVDWIGPWLGP